MPSETIDRLIINSPYIEPTRHWVFDRSTRLFDLVDGRRPAGYLIASKDSKKFDDPGHFVEISLVNQIRTRVRRWREGGYPGVTSVTKRLLDYWNDPEESARRRFFYCQLEAIETLIWFTEGSIAEKVGIDIPVIEGSFQRLCAKMATGTGKTVVMAMVIAWQVLNKAVDPQNPRFSRNILVIAPGLTVKHRLAVLMPSALENYYDEFSIVPLGLFDLLRKGRVVIRNWHALSVETEEKSATKKSVDKRGPKSDAAFLRDVLGRDMARAKNILVINDEAHHAWRVSSQSKTTGVASTMIEKATKWIDGLDRIHSTRGILRCFDFSATPFAPSGQQNSAGSLFGWIVSDFGLNDAIESGLVKTPRVVIRDDALPEERTLKSRLYRIYDDPEVRDNLNRKATPEEPLPDLVVNAYYLLGYDWRETARKWATGRRRTPPVMITVANRTETAARIKYMFDRKKVQIEELCDRRRTLHIDSRVLEKAEAAEESVMIDTQVIQKEDNQLSGTTEQQGVTKLQPEEFLRRQVDTIGQIGKPGELIQNVISVGMLSEGWDAKTVTHIMGLRAFSSQLLCEQVVGRGLRRTSYEVDSETGLFRPEYVNIFGVPFTFLPHENVENGNGPPQPKVIIEPEASKVEFAIAWPNVIRIDRMLRPRMSVEWLSLDRLVLDARKTARIAELAPTVDGVADVMAIKSIDLIELARERRMQSIIFETARDVYDQMHSKWRGDKWDLLGQLIGLVEDFIRSDRIEINPALFQRDSLRRRLMITLNMTKVVQHIFDAVCFENTEGRELVFERERAIVSTGDMRPWATSRRCISGLRCHINHCVVDSAWEANDAYALDQSPDVDAWVKNDHLGFEVFYMHRGVVRKYRPDFLVRFKSGKMLVLETKGRYTDKDHAKRKYLEEWVRGVNEHGGFGSWCSDISFSPNDIHNILAKHA